MLFVVKTLRIIGNLPLRKGYLYVKGIVCFCWIKDHVKMLNKEYYYFCFFCLSIHLDHSFSYKQKQNHVYFCVTVSIRQP